MGSFVAGVPGPAFGDPGARPRELVRDPDAFGQSTSPLEPADGIDPTDARFVAANLQHWVANAVREAVLLSRTNLISFLENLTVTSPELSYARVVRLQEGQEAMRLSDLMAWSTRLDTVREILRAMFSELGEEPPASPALSVHARRAH